MNPGKTRWSGPAHDVSENRFCLIVRGMRNGNTCRASFLDEPMEKCVAEAPARVLEIPSMLRGRCRHIFAPQNKFNSTRTREVGHEARVLIGFSTPQAVIEVNRQ